PEHLGCDGDNLHLDAAAFGVTDVEGAAGLVVRLLSLGSSEFRYDLRGRWDEIAALQEDTFACHAIIRGLQASEACLLARERRRPTGDSVSPTTALPVNWNRKDNVVWSTPIPGWGNSTPAIWQDAIFVTTQDGERLLLLRLDRQTGSVVWQKECSQGSPLRKG